MHDTAAPTRIGIIIVGDELLSGKRRDGHMPAVIDILAARGLELSWAYMVGDDADQLQATLQRTLAGPDLVFSFGGIGPTPDDRTRQCAAAAAGVPLEVNSAGRDILQQRYGAAGATPARIAMVEWPVGATVIPNPVNQVPGFSLQQHHFVPGFPKMAWPMVEWVLDTHYRAMHKAAPLAEYLLTAHDTPESRIIDVMQAVIDAWPDVRVACLPNSETRGDLEFGVRGDAETAAAAYADLAQKLAHMGVALAHTRPPA